MVVADLSASMGGWDRLARLRKALELLSRDNRGAAIGLVFSGAGPDLPALPPSLDHTAFLQAAATLRAWPFRGSHAAAISQARGMLSTTGNRRLVVMSDFQRGDWQGVGTGLVPEEIDLQLLDLAGTPPFENAGIVAAQVKIGAGRRQRVIADCRNFGTTETTRKLTLSATDFSATTELTIPAGQTRKAAFVLETTSGSGGVLELDADSYPADDTFQVWLGARPAVQVLAVVPLQNEPEKANELFFLKRALETKADLEFKLETVEPDFFFALNLAPVRVLILAGAAGYFNVADFAKVREFLENGGTVLCTPGAAAGHLFRGLRTAGLLQAEMLERLNPDRRNPEEMVTLGWMNPESLLAKLFKDPAASGLFLFPLRSYSRLRVDDPEALILLRSSQDEAILIERSVGRGRLFVSALSFDPAGSDLPLTVSFVPLILELLTTAVPPGYGVENLECGAALPAIASIIDGTTTTTDQESAAELRQRLNAPGVFEHAGQPFQVNVPRGESIQEQILLAELQGRLRSGAADTAPAASAGVKTDPAHNGTAQPIWHYCAMLAALLFLLEMSLAVFLDNRHEKIARANSSAA
jgi:hypothetical protein